MKQQKKLNKNKIPAFAFFFIFVPIIFGCSILLLQAMYNHFFTLFIVLFSFYIISGTGFLIFAIYLFWRFALGNFALKYKPSLIPYFFKDKKDRGSFVITKNYFLGKYYFDREEYEQAESYFMKALNSLFHKKINLEDFKGELQPYNDKIKEEIKGKVDKLYEENNDFTAFFKTIKLYFLWFMNMAAGGADWFLLGEQSTIYFIKTRKINSPKYDFLHDFDEDEGYFKENRKPKFEDENLSEKEKTKKQFVNAVESFDGSIDFLCIESKILLEFNNYEFYKKALKTCTKCIEKLEKSPNQTILWRLLYVRGCAYHKLGEVDLACKDWKRGIELGDVEFSQKMYDENCKHL